VEENKTENSVYEKMPWKERLQLRKHYYKKVNRLEYAAFILALVLYLPMFVVAGFVFYGFYNIMLGKTAYNFWIWIFAFTFLTFAIMHLIMWSMKGFHRWLWKEKNVLSTYWAKPKSDATKLKLYAELTKTERRALRKEYLTNVNPKAKMWRLLSIIVPCVILCITVVNLITWLAGVFIFQVYPNAFGIFGIVCWYLFVYSHLVYKNFWQWLEYEKNIVRRVDKHS